MKNKRPWYEIRAQSDTGAAEILIYDMVDPVWGVGAKQFLRDLAAVNAEQIDVRINSPGGSVFEGMAIYHGLLRHKARIVTHVDGVAASIASVIFLAGDERRMGAGTYLMVHNPHVATVGDAEGLRKTANTVEKVQEELVDLYADAADQTKRQARQWMKEETWFTADDAREARLAHAVEAGGDIRAAFDWDKLGFRRVPEALVAAAVAGDPAATPKTIRDVEKILRDGGFSHSAAKAIAASGYKANPDPRDEDGEPTEAPAAPVADAEDGGVERLAAALLTAHLALGARTLTRS